MEDVAMDYYDGYFDEWVKYCDIYECEECPKYGETCDGQRKEEEQ